MRRTNSGSGQNNLDSSNKQMMGGCMAAFFNFSHLLSGKRLHHKRLPAPPTPTPFASEDATTESVSSVGSPAFTQQPEKSHLQYLPDPELRSLVSDPMPKSPLQGVSTFEFKEAVKSPWKFAREAPRLSLDSRAVVDAEGGLRPREVRINAAGCGGDEETSDNQRRSPCVIARLMGLEPPPSSAPAEKAELRRSASESRWRDYRLLDTPSFLSPNVASRNESDQSANRNYNINHNAVKSKNQNQNQNQNQNRIQINQRRLMAERKSCYNTADFFPPEIHAKKHQQQHQAVTIYGEIERRLRMRGIDEPSKDLETLKHILEALQLKGLLHSSPAASTATTAAPRRNLVSDREYWSRRRTPASSSDPSATPRRERPSTARTPGRSSSPPVRRKGGPLTVETPPRRSLQSPVQSPKTMKRCDHQNQTVTRSPRGRRSTVEMNHRGERFSGRGPSEDDASTVAEGSFGTSSHTEAKRWRAEEYHKEGWSLLERCDKLLHSIAEMNSNSNSNSKSNTNSAELQQPSPVSVLDSSFDKEDDSPSPVKKRSIDFRDQVLPELEDELWSPSSLSSSSSSSSRTQLPSNPDHHHHQHGIDSSLSEDHDFIYVSEVFRASNYLLDEPDLFLLLEKQMSIRGNKEETSNVSFLQRKLIFDTVVEILDRAHRLPPWKLGPRRPSLQLVWDEFRRIRQGGPGQDLFEVISGVLKKDLADDSITGWGECPVEMSEAVLDIERLIFKDLICESIQDLAAVAGKNVVAQRHCRKLVF